MQQQHPTVPETRKFSSSPSGNETRKVVTIERELPPLTYELVEANLKHVQGQVLTLLEASLPEKQQREAAKNLVKSFFNDKLTWLFDLYGQESIQETPNYSQEEIE